MDTRTGSPGANAPDFGATLHAVRHRLAEAAGVGAGQRVLEFGAAETWTHADGAFDVTLSAFGAMFAPDPALTARQMLRITRAGGRIGLASWTPDSFVGRLLKLVAAHVPPPAGAVQPTLPALPTLWGTAAQLQRLFGPEAAQMHCERRVAELHFASPAQALQACRELHGPSGQAWAALGPTARRALERDLHALLDAMNTAGVGSPVVPGEYLEAVIHKPGTPGVA